MAQNLTTLTDGELAQRHDDLLAKIAVVWAAWEVVRDAGASCHCSEYQTNNALQRELGDVFQEQGKREMAQKLSHWNYDPLGRELAKTGGRW